MRASTRYLFGACLPTNRPRRYGGGWNGFGSWGKSYAFKTSRRYRGGRAGVVGLVLMRGRAWRSVAASFVLHGACHVRRGRAELPDSNEHCAAGSARVVSLSERGIPVAQGEPAVDWKLAEAACVGGVFLCPPLRRGLGCAMSSRCSCVDRRSTAICKAMRIQACHRRGEWRTKR